MNASLATLLWDAAAARPGHGAVVQKGVVTTYEALRARAAAAAESLAAAGLVPGDRAALLLDRSADAVAMLFGIHAAGLTAVVLNERMKPRQIEYQLANSGARGLLTSVAMLGRLHRKLDTSAVVVDVDSVPPAGSAVPVKRAPDDFAHIIYTSGSTGLPKGVAFPLRALRAGVSIVNGYLGQRDSDRIASLLGMSTVYGVNQVLTTVASGATLVVETSPLANDIVTSLREHGATVLAAVPPLWLQLLASRLDAQSVPSLRLLQNAGGHLPVEAVRRLRLAFPDAQIFLQYGQTETFRGTFLPPAEVDKRPDSMGRAVPEAELRVLREDGTEADAGEIGELVHSGPTIATGYWENPEASARVFRAHPDAERAARGEKAVFSGDLVRRDAEGFFYFTSRRDRLIKTMGFRVGPDDVADVIHASGQVQEAVVVGEPDPERGERIVAYVVLRQGGDPVTLSRYCRAELPPFMVPARIEPRGELPRLVSGKYDIAALR